MRPRTNEQALPPRWTHQVGDILRGMRIKRRSRSTAGVVSVVALASFTACFWTGSCTSITLQPGAPRVASSTSVALSCVESFTFDGTDFGPWCAGVRPGLLGDVIAHQESTSERTIMRSIEGVPHDQAVALKVSVPGTTGNELDDECGRWRFTPASTTPHDEAVRLARTVVQPRFLRSLGDLDA